MKFYDRQGTHSMLETDFVSEFDLLVENRLNDNFTGLFFSGLQCICLQECVYMTIAAEGSYKDILCEFLTLTSFLQGNEPVLYNVTYRIETKGTSTLSKPRRLAPPPS